MNEVSTNGKLQKGLKHPQISVYAWDPGTNPLETGTNPLWKLRDHWICLSLSDLFHFSTLPSKSNNIVVNGKISFFFMVE